jgi:hypothetical protein
MGSRETVGISVGFRLNSDFGRQGIESSRRHLPVIESSSSRTAARPSIPVVPQRSVEWGGRAWLAPMDHCGVRCTMSDLRLLGNLECVIDLDVEVPHC